MAEKIRKAMRNYLKYFAILLIVSFMAASCSSSRKYPNYSASESTKHYKKSKKKYGSASKRNIPIKKNYKVRD